AERLLADGLPEVAAGERLAAAAPLVVAQVPLPQVHHLAQRAHGGQLAQDAFQQRGAAASESTDEHHAHHGILLSRSVRITNEGGGRSDMSEKEGEMKASHTEGMVGRMTAKVTLSFSDDTIADAKLWAQRDGVSLSAWIDQAARERTLRQLFAAHAEA